MSSSASRPPFRRHDVVRAIVALLLLLGGISQVVQIRAVQDLEPRFPVWDPAKYGAAGARLAQDLAAGDPIGLVAHVDDLSLWPPGLPLFLAPFFLVFGPRYDVAQLLVLCLLPLAAASAALACSAIVRGDRSDQSHACALLVATLAASALLASPSVRLFSALLMAELPGVVLLFLAIASYARACRVETDWAWRSTAALSTALFFLKFNYGLLWLAPLVLGELVHAAGGIRRLAQRCGAILRGIDLRRPLHVSVIAAVVAVGLLAGADGKTIALGESGGVRVSLGNSLYALYLLALVILFLRKRWRIAAITWIRKSGRRMRIFLAWTALPIALWMLLPGHLKDMVKFLENRSDGPPITSVAGLAYYPRAFLSDFSPHPLVGAAWLALALITFGSWRRCSRARRTLLLALATNLIAVLLHPYKQPRFLFTVAPLIWIAGALGFADGLLAVSRSLRPARIGALTDLLAVACAIVPFGWSVDSARLARELQGWSAPASIAPLLDEIANRALDSRGSALVGYWNELSPGLVEWHMRQQHGRVEDSRIPVEPRYLARSRDPGEIVDRLAGSGRIERVLVLDSTSTGGGSRERSFRDETGWLDAVRERIAGDPRFLLESSTDHPETEHRLRTYRVAR